MKSVLHCYTRVSSRVQETDGTSLDSQKEIGIRKSKELGMDCKIWNEGAKSSSNEDLMNRPKMQELLRDMEDGKIKHLFVYNNDRLSRNEATQFAIKNAIKRNDVVLYTKDGTYDLNNPTDSLMKKLLDGVAEYDNAIRAERSRLGKLQKARRGEWHGGHPPYGYEIKQSKLEMHSEEKKHIKKIYADYLKGTTVVDIKMNLDANGITPRRGGAFWSMGSLHAILRNTVYVGRYTFTDKKSEESVEVSAPAIVDDSVWYAAQTKRKGVLKRRGQINRTQRFYLLRDFMICGHCGNPMGAKTGDGVKQRHNYYYCPTKERNWESSVNGSASEIALTNKTKWQRGKHCVMVRSLNIDKTDDAVWEAVKETIAKSHILKERMKQELLADKGKDDAEYKSDLRNYKDRERKALKALKLVEETIGKIETDMLLQKMDAKLFKTVRKNLENERTKTTNDVEQIRLLIKENVNKKRWIDWVSKFKDTYEDVDRLTPPERKEFLLGLLDKIEVFLDTDTLEHNINILFQLPIVEDQYDNEAKNTAPKVLDGLKTQTIQGVYVAKRGRKKSKKKQ